MAVVQNLNSSLTINNKINSFANITLATNTVFVDGNLIVGGNSTNVYKTDLSISDNTITLNKGEPGTGVTLITAGLEVDRGLAPNVSLLWNETYSRWTLTTDGTTFANIATSTGAGTMALIGDPAPQLGGPLDTLDQVIFSSNTTQIKFEDNLAIKNTTVDPNSISNYNVVYAKTPELGHSGLYITNTSYNNQELITKSKAVWYSLIM